MKHKTSELTGALLDAAVALAEGWTVEQTQDDGPIWYDCANSHRRYLPGWSSDWGHGGPIIERERLELRVDKQWTCMGNGCYGEGPTPLIAAMRAYVSAKFGDEVELPD